MRMRRVFAALGGILKILSLTFLVPLVASFIWDSTGRMLELPLLPWDLRATTVVFFLMFLFVLFLGHLMSFYGVRELDELREREGFVIVGMAWLIVALLGAIPFLMLGVIGSPLHALFEAMSGVTTTGATLLQGTYEDLPASVMLWRAMLQYIGGLGIIVMSIAVIGRLTEGGHKILAAEASGGTVARIKPKITQTAKSLSIIYLIMTGIIFVSYLLLMRFSPVGIDWKTASLDALGHAFTTLATGGFSNHGASMAYYGSDSLLWASSLFMVASSVSFPLYWAAFHGAPGKLWRSGEARFLAILVVASATIVSTVLTINGQDLGDAITHGTFQVASILSTTGYTSTNHDAFPQAARLVLLLLMVTGGMAGSTAGGLKVFRIHILMKLTRRETQKLLHPHAVATVKNEGRIMPDAFLRRIVVFFFAYITLLLIGTFVHAFLGLDIVAAFSASATVQGNVGPGFGAVAVDFVAVHDLGKAFAILQMWMGRLEIFTVLLLFLPATYRD